MKMERLIIYLSVFIFYFNSYGLSFKVPSPDDLNPFSFHKKNTELKYKPLSDDVKEYIKHVFLQNDVLQEVALQKAEILNNIAYYKFSDTEEDKNIAVHTAYNFAKIDTCLDAVSFKYLGYSKETIFLLQTLNKNLKMLILDKPEKIKNYAKFNGLLNSLIIDIPVATGENYGQIIDKYCPEEIRKKIK